MILSQRLTSATGDPVALLLERLEGVRRSRGGYIARCPAHEDRNASLSIGVGDDGRALVRCFAGCATADVCAAVGLNLAELFAKRGDRPSRAAVRKPIAKPRIDDRPKRTPAELQTIDAQCRADLTDNRLATLSARLRVSRRSLQAFGVGWIAGAYAFAMRDADGTIIGIRTRHNDGKKRCLTGSRLGLILPTSDAPYGGDVIYNDMLLIAEGESDAAAALDLGYRAVGRPGCVNCESTVVEYVCRARPARVVILADADDPGQRGGHALARSIARAGNRVRVLTLPDEAKDLREWKARGGTTHDLAGLIDAPPTRSEVSL